MKKLFMHRIVLLVYFLSVIFVSSNAQNLVANSGFETLGDDGKPAEWTYYGSNVTFSAATDAVNSGTYSLNVNVTTTSASSRSISQHIAVTAGKTYTVAFFYRVYRAPSSTSGGVQCSISWTNAEGIDVDVNLYVSPLLTYSLNEWAQEVFTITVPEGAAFMDLWIDANRNIGVYLDDVVVFDLDGGAGLLDVKNTANFARQGGPAVDEAQFTFASAGAEATITVVALDGRIVATTAVAQGSTSASVRVGGLPKGVYVARYQDRSGRRGTVKFVKK